MSGTAQLWGLDTLAAPPPHFSQGQRGPGQPWLPSIHPVNIRHSPQVSYSAHHTSNPGTAGPLGRGQAGSILPRAEGTGRSGVPPASAGEAHRPGGKHRMGCPWAKTILQLHLSTYCVPGQGSEPQGIPAPTVCQATGQSPSGYQHLLCARLRVRAPGDTSTSCVPGWGSKPQSTSAPTVCQAGGQSPRVHQGNE